MNSYRRGERQEQTHNFKPWKGEEAIPQSREVPRDDLRLSFPFNIIYRVIDDTISIAQSCDRKRCSEGERFWKDVYILKRQAFRKYSNESLGRLSAYELCIPPPCQDPFSGPAYHWNG
jgi:hypothetical protein